MEPGSTLPSILLDSMEPGSTLPSILLDGMKLGSTFPNSLLEANVAHTIHDSNDKEHFSSPSAVFVYFSTTEIRTVTPH